MWLRFDKKIEYIAKGVHSSGLIKKFLSGYIVVLILLMSFSMIFMATVGAGDNLELSGVEPKEEPEDKTIELIDEPKEELEEEKPEEEIIETKSEQSVEPKEEPEDKTIELIDETKYKTYDDNGDDDDTLEIIVSKVERELGNISKGERKKITTENSEKVSICSVDFTPSADLGEVKLSVTKIEGKPEDIIEEPTIINQTIYVYLDIKLISDEGYVGENKTESMKFEFKVARTWINENNIDKETVILKRYHDEWQTLTTKLLSEDDTYIYYEAETPGLSTFAVVGSELVESSASYVEEVPEMPWILNIGIIASSSTMLFVVIFKARYIYLDEEDGVKGSKKKLSRKLR